MFVYVLNTYTGHVLNTPAYTGDLPGVRKSYKAEVGLPVAGHASLQYRDAAREHAILDMRGYLHGRASGRLATSALTSAYTGDHVCIVGISYPYSVNVNTNNSNYKK